MSVLLFLYLIVLIAGAATATAIQSEISPTNVRGLYTWSPSEVPSSVALIQGCGPEPGRRVVTDRGNALVVLKFLGSPLIDFGFKMNSAYASEMYRTAVLAKLHNASMSVSYYETGPAPDKPEYLSFSTLNGTRKGACRAVTNRYVTVRAIALAEDLQ